MYADTCQSVYIRLPRGRGAGPTAYIYASCIETVKQVPIFYHRHSLSYAVNHHYFDIIL